MPEIDINLIRTSIEFFVENISGILISTCQFLAIFVILIGVVKALFIFLQNSLIQPQTTIAFQKSRLEMGYSFSLGLSFLVGGSILKTMISSRWDDIARLAAIILVRTILNLLLERAISKSDK